jgi:O-antigen/teichoic acid export membrane protein
VAAVPTDVVRVGLGNAWLSAAPVVAWIAVGTAFQVAGDVAGLVLVTRGLSRPLARLSFITAGLTIVGVLVGSAIGLTAVAVGYAAAAAMVWPLSLWTLRTAAGLPARPLAVSAVRVMLVASAASLSARWVATTVGGPSVLRLAVACVVVGLVVAVAAGVMRPVRRDMRDLWEMARLGLRRRGPQSSLEQHSAEA